MANTHGWTSTSLSCCLPYFQCATVVCELLKQTVKHHSMSYVACQLFDVTSSAIFCCPRPFWKAYSSDWPSGRGIDEDTSYNLCSSNDPPLTIEANTHSSVLKQSSFDHTVILHYKPHSHLNTNGQRLVRHRHLIPIFHQPFYFLLKIRSSSFFQHPRSLHV